MAIKLLTLLAILLVFDIASSQSCLGSTGLGKWVRAKNGEIPNGAVSGGLDKKRTQYICRSGGICGKVMEKSACYVAYYKEESADETYDVLTDVSGVWVPILDKTLPCNTLKTGNFASDPLYSCRIKYKKTLTIGKVENNVCIIPYGGTIHKYKKNYEVFTAVPESVETNQGNHIILKGDGKYFAFQLKSTNGANVSFGKNRDLLYSVNLGMSAVSIGPIESPNAYTKNASELLSDNEFKSYWIRWFSDKLEIGVEGNLKPLISYTNKGVKEIDTIQLSSLDASEWKIPSLTEF